MKRNLLYACITVLIWATMAAIVKLMLSDVPNQQVLSVSSWFSFLFLLAVNLKNGSLKRLRQFSLRQYAAMSALGFLGLFLYSALYYYGIGQLGAQVACILNYLWPMMLMLFSTLILKERLTVLKAAAMVCSFAGIIVLSSGSGGGESSLAGTVCCIVAAACYGLFSVLNKKAGMDQGMTMMVAWLTTAILSGALGLATETWVMPTLPQWLGLLWLGAVVQAVGYLLWAMALQGTGNTAAIANLAYLTPFLSLVISAVLLKESVQPRALAALVLIIGGILLQTLFDKKRP